MTDIAIRVENLGKAYRIGHQASGQRGRYRTLRDDLLALLMFRGRKASTGKSTLQWNRLWRMRNLCRHARYAEKIRGAR